MDVSRRRWLGGADKLKQTLTSGYTGIRHGRKEMRLSAIVTEKELAEELGIHQRTLYSYRKNDPTFPVRYLGPRLIRYDLDEVMEWIEANER